MKTFFCLFTTILFFNIHFDLNAQCCGRGDGCGELFENGGIYFGYSTSNLTEAPSDILDAMSVFNAAHTKYTKPYSFNKKGRGLHVGTFFYLDRERRSFMNIGYTNKHYISTAEGDSLGYLSQHLLRSRIGTLDMGFSYYPVKFIKTSLEFNAGRLGVFKKSGEKSKIDDLVWEDYYSDQGFLFGVTPSISLWLRFGPVSFYISPYYQWTPNVITHYDSNGDGIIDKTDKRYSNKFSNYGVQFSMYLFFGRR